MFLAKDGGHYFAAKGGNHLHQLTPIIDIQIRTMGRESRVYAGGYAGGQIRPDGGCRQEKNLGLLPSDEIGNHPRVRERQIFLQQGIIRDKDMIRPMRQEHGRQRVYAMPQENGSDF